MTHKARSFTSHLDSSSSVTIRTGLGLSHSSSSAARTAQSIERVAMRSIKSFKPFFTDRGLMVVQSCLLLLMLRCVALRRKCSHPAIIPAAASGGETTQEKRA